VAENRQTLQLIDVFIERRQLKRRVEIRTASSTSSSKE